VTTPNRPATGRGAATALRGLIRVSGVVNRALAAVAGVALIATMLILVANIVMRTVAAPMNGTFELISMTAVVVFGLALGEAHTHRAHVSIDLLVGRLRKRARLLVGVAVTIASAALFVQLATSLVIYGINLREQGAATESLAIPIWPSALVVVLGIGGLVLALVADLAKAWLARTSDEPHLNIF
jgi:TRAP-type C4-dicarboxylate transport system permease small subunit